MTYESPLQMLAVGRKQLEELPLNADRFVDNLPTVFLVDDDPAIRASLGMSLRTAGFAVECFGDAGEFLAAYNSDRPGCLLLDVRMPGLSGIELQKILVLRGSRLPIIFMSGHSNARDVKKALAAGAVDFLEKPFRRSVLIARLSEVIRSQT